MKSEQGKEPLAVTVAENGMEATVALRPGTELTRIGVPDVLAALAGAGITVSSDVKDRIAAYLQWLSDTPSPQEPFVIAQGKPPEEGADGGIDLASSVEEGPFPGFVEQGSAVGRLLAPRPGVSGYDVRQNELVPARIPSGVVLGHNVVIDEADPSLVRAAVTGKVQCDPSTICVRRALVIGGDVDVQTGDLDVGVDVLVRGTVRDGRRVRTSGSLFVEGSVEAADVAASEVVIRGGIAGNESGSVRSGGIVRARFVNGAALEAGGDVTLEQECINAQVSTNGRLLLEGGAIMGGEVFARTGVAAPVLGSEGGTPTALALGLSDAQLERLGQLEREQTEHRAGLRSRKEELAALNASPAPSPKARERMTELAFEIAELEGALRALDADIQQLVPRRDAEDAATGGPPSSAPCLAVSERIWQGVTVRINDRVAFFENPVEGPVKLVLQQERTERFIAAIDETTGQTVRTWSGEAQALSPAAG